MNYKATFISFPNLAASCKQDKLTLVQSLKSYQMKEPNLECQLQTTKDELEQCKLMYRNEKQEKESLRSQLSEKKKLVYNMQTKIKSQNELCKKQYSILKMICSSSQTLC